MGGVLKASLVPKKGHLWEWLRQQVTDPLKLAGRQQASGERNQLAGG